MADGSRRKLANFRLPTSVGQMPMEVSWIVVVHLWLYRRHLHVNRCNSLHHINGLAEAIASSITVASDVTALVEIGASLLSVVADCTGGGTTAPMTTRDGTLDAYDHFTVTIG
ncbi:hypothetical protein GUJ93_ZPchr0006g45181, partial [Zizania palustris]